MKNLILLSVGLSLIMYSCSDSTNVTSDNAIELSGQIEHLSKKIQHLDSVQNARIDNIENQLKTLEQLLVTNSNNGKWQLQDQRIKMNTQTGEVYQYSENKWRLLR